MDKLWHRINFKIKLGQNTKAKFYIDLIIIDLLIYPTIKKFEDIIELWSFHRSFHAEDEKEGQRLKFNFYTTKEEAKEILDFVKNNEFYTIIKNNFLDTNYLKEINLEFIGTEENSKKIEAISDREWPLEIQKSWPYYIRGVCKMLITMIESIKINKSVQISKNNSEKLGEYYEDIEKELNKKWFEKGSHAFFHHLWGVFGYTPLRLIFASKNRKLELYQSESKRTLRKLKDITIDTNYFGFSDPIDIQ